MAMTRPRRGHALAVLLQRPCGEPEGADLARILQLYLGATTFDGLAQKQASCDCQKLLWQVAVRNEWTDEALLFSDYILRMVTNLNWNFLAQHLVTLCSPSQLEVFCKRLMGHGCNLAKDIIGCRLLCRICEQGRFSEGALQLLEELVADLPELVAHPYANFVVMKILEAFPAFTGMDAALMQCAVRRGGQQGWGSEGGCWSSLVFSPVQALALEPDLGRAGQGC